MTDATVCNTYPQYCFHLSPTINRWCHLQARDVLALKDHRGFEGQDVYFYLNHPIKWVRISGVVVSINEFEWARFYMIDDGSGATIECVVKVDPQAKPGITADATTATTKSTAAAGQNRFAIIDNPIDIGHVLDIKGSVRTFRDNKQVHAEKIVHLHSTDQEIVFWEKMAQLKSEVLSSPWFLDEREVRRCRKAEEAQYRSQHSRNAGERKKTGLEKASVQTAPHEEGRARKRSRDTTPGPALPIRKKTGLERVALRVEETEKNIQLGKTAPGWGAGRRTGLERVTGLERNISLNNKAVPEIRPNLERKIGPEGLGISERRTGLERKTGLEKRNNFEKGVGWERKAGLEKITGLERRTGLGRDSDAVRNMELRNKTGWRQERRTGLERMGSFSRAETEARGGGGESIRSQTPFQEGCPPPPRPVRLTGLEKRRPVEPITRQIPVTGKYDALGL